VRARFIQSRIHQGEQLRPIAITSRPAESSACFVSFASSASARPVVSLGSVAVASIEAPAPTPFAVASPI